MVNESEYFHSSSWLNNKSEMLWSCDKSYMAQNPFEGTVYHMPGTVPSNVWLNHVTTTAGQLPVEFWRYPTQCNKVAKNSKSTIRYISNL